MQEWIPFIAQVIFALVVFHMILGMVAYLILLERKSASWIQDRIGPNRVGPGGLLQPLADGVKFILKEEFVPKNADKFLYFLAPIAIMTPAMVGWAIIPWGGILEKGASIFGVTFAENWPVMVADLNIGVLLVIAAAGLAVYGVVLGGYSSGSKYSFLGGLRATAQMLSYEVPMALSIMAVALILGSLSLTDLVNGQTHYWLGVIPAWNIFVHPVAGLIFITCIFAEANRVPFDLPECETELVGGYHTEYSSMKFALFFLAEYGSMVTGSAVAVALFFGGWHLPWLDYAIYGGAQPAVGGWGAVLLKFCVFWAKVVGFLFFYMWVRWTLPRFRFDQLMDLAWRGMIPLALGSFLISAVVVFLNRMHTISDSFVPALLLILNVIFFVAALGVITMRPKRVINKRIAVPGSRYNPVPAAE